MCLFPPRSSSPPAKPLQKVNFPDGLHVLVPQEHPYTYEQLHEKAVRANSHTGYLNAALNNTVPDTGDGTGANMSQPRTARMPGTRIAKTCRKVDGYQTDSPQFFGQKTGRRGAGMPGMNAGAFGGPASGKSQGGSMGGIGVESNIRSSMGSNNGGYGSVSSMGYPGRPRRSSRRSAQS